MAPRSLSQAWPLLAGLALLAAAALAAFAPWSWLPQEPRDRAPSPAPGAAPPSAPPPSPSSLPAPAITEPRRASGLAPGDAPAPTPPPREPPTAPAAELAADDPLAAARRRIRELARAPGEESFLALLERAHAPSTPESLRPAVLEALAGQPRADEVAPLFAARLREAPAPEERRAAAAALGKLARPAEAPALRSAFAAERDPTVRAAILGALGTSADAEAPAFLAGAAREPGAGPDQRLAAAQALRRIGSEEARALLAALLREERDPALRRHLERWLEGR